MFEFLRKGSTSLLAKIFLAIIIIVFVFWGIGSFTSYDKDNIAKVNGERITLKEFQELYHYKLLQIRQTLGDLPEEELKKLNLKEEILQELIQRKLINDLAKELGVKVTQEELNMTLRQIPFFQEKGVFNQAKYKAFLRELGLSASSFEKLIYADLLQQKLKTLITSPLLVSKEEVQDFTNFYFQRLSLEEFILPLEVCEKEVKAEEKDLESYFHAHRDMYVEDERVKLAYFKLPFEGDVDVSEVELKNYYSQNLNRFKEPFKVKLRKLFVPGLSEVSFKKAEEERKKIKALKDFASFGVSNGEWFEEDALPQEIKSIIKSSRVGDILGPLKTSQGYLILGIEEIKEGGILKFEEVKPKLKEELKKEKIKEKVRAKANEIYAQVVKENGLKLWADKRGIKVELTDYLTIEDLARLFYSRELAHKILKGGRGDYFSPLETEKALYLIEILDKKPKRNLSFEEAKELVKRDFLKEKRKAVCESKVQAFFEKSKSQKNYTTLASEFGFKINKVELQRKDLPEEIANFISQTGLINKPLWTEKEVKLIYLIKISPPEKAPSEEEYTFISQLLLKYKGEALLKNILENYQKKAKIKIYPLFQQL